MLLYFHVLFVLALSLTSKAVSEKDASCTTPDNRNGRCISIYSCRSLLNGIALRNDTVIELAKKSQCGYANGRALVCCDEDETAAVQKHKDLLPGLDVCGFLETDRIIGGVVAQLFEYRWMVLLEYKDRVTGKNAGFRCAGTLINKRYILTAASCLSDENYELTNVRLGEHDLSTDPDCEGFAPVTICLDPIRSVKVDKIAKHPNYDGKSENNIGLVRMEKETEYTDSISPVCLPFVNIDPSPPIHSTAVAGWKTDGNDSRLHHLMDLTDLSRDDCKNGISKDKHLGINLSCASNRRTVPDPCIGNAGNPFMQIFMDGEKKDVNMYQVGVIAWSEGCNSSQPIVYTNVANYMPWILNTISDI